MARTAAVLVLTAGVRLHHHWSGHRSVVAVGRCRIWRSQCRRGPPVRRRHPAVRAQAEVVVLRRNLCRHRNVTGEASPIKPSVLPLLAPTPPPTVPPMSPPECRLLRSSPSQTCASNASSRNHRGVRRRLFAWHCAPSPEPQHTATIAAGHRRAPPSGAFLPKLRAPTSPR
jgi:hypothetical protein